ncbi:MAG TPA: class I SAM-dependent methyltransferase [Tepidisphaeraceae bacterium]|nr:class I SAM-dependent methyltransferase [Tepidisphaeraceae bacterium]
MTLPSFTLPPSPPTTPCKFCKFEASLFGIVDFNKSCEDHKREALPLSGIPVYYHRCPRCRLVFTIAFDHFSNADFLAHIYNEGYAAVDPDYATIRPTGNAGMLAQIFGASKNISILDYGGGNGTLAAALRTAGFTDVVTFDPFVAEFSKRPERRFDLVVCFEVVEHTTKPMTTFADLDSLMKRDGLMLFSTLLQPDDIDVVKTGWWYLAPRNGHVTLYNGSVLQTLLAGRGLKFGSCNANLHAAWRKVPEFAKHFITV